MIDLKTAKITTVTITCQDTCTLKEEEREVNYFNIDLGNNLAIAMASIPEGSFIMGSPATEEGRNEDENPQHEVKLNSFLMSKYLITQEQYLAIMKENPASFQGKNNPVENVDWYNAQDFCQKLSDLTQFKFRLPSEAEWEYACRAGKTTPFSYGETLTTDLANYKGLFNYGKGNAGIYRGATTKVGTFPPNAFGLYDLHGNLWEWCADCWHENYYNAPTNNKPWEDYNPDDDELPRVLRGGSWDDTSYYCRSAVRIWTSPSLKGKLIGFRVVCSN